MILHRSAGGVIASEYFRIVVRPKGALLARRATSREFQAGALDAAIVSAFDLVVLVEALARDMAQGRGLSLTDPTNVPAGRSAVLRLWIGEPDDPRQIWIRGRVVTAKVAGVEYEAPFDVHLANGFPKAFTDAFSPKIIEAVHDAVTRLKPLPCLCHTGTEYIEEHDTLETLLSRSDPDEPHVSVTFARCTVCNTGWTFGRNTERPLGSGSAVKAFSRTADFVGEEVDRIIAALRAGAEATVGNMPYQTKYTGRNGVLVSEYFNGERAEDPCEVAEASLRTIILDHREDFLDVLRKPLRERLKAALLETRTREAERSALSELLAYGDCLNSTEVFEAVIAWPDEKPTPEASATIEKEKDGNDLHHAIMSGIGHGTTSAAGGRFGLRFFSTVAEMLGHERMRDFRRYRAHFRAMANDLRGALDDLEWTKSQLTKDDEYLDREIASIRRRIEDDAQRPKRTLTIILVHADDPDQLDDMSYEARRESCAGWKRLELLHEGEPDVLVRKALDLDMGVYGAARAWDEDTKCVEETSCIFYSDLEESAAMLREHLAEPLVLAKRLIDHAGSGEDPARVARALEAPMTEPAGGPAEEAATYIRVFLGEVPDALRFATSIAWEHRTPAACSCAAWDGMTLGNITAFPKSQFETLVRDGDKGWLRCVHCKATFSFTSVPTHSTLAREALPAQLEATLFPQPLAALPVFAGYIATTLEGEVIAFGAATAIRVDGYCVLLIREHEGAFALSLPLAGSWRVSTTAEWHAAWQEIWGAYHTHPRVVSLGDVIARLSPEWTLEPFAKETKVPRRASLRRGEQILELSQNADSVTIKAPKRTREIGTLAALDDLPTWTASSCD